MTPPAGGFDLWLYLGLPALIFLARICDVSLGTIRIIFVTRGLRLLAPLVGFFEVLIWLMAISQIMRHLTDWPCYLAYAAGFAAGNFVGISIENRLAMGVALVRIIVSNGAESLITHLHETGCAVTVVDAQGQHAPVKMIYSIVRRKQIRAIADLLRQKHPDAIYAVEDVRSVSPQAFGRRGPVCPPRI